MKQLLALLCITFLCSCSVFKKASNTTQSNTDSTDAKSSFVVDLKKKDTTGATHTVVTNSKTSDSGYKKKTVIEEYYSDELDFEGKDPAKNPPKDSNAKKSIVKHLAPPNSPGTLLYRKTTIEEEGAKKAVENASMLNETTAQIKGVDSSVKSKDQKVSVSTNHEQNKSSSMHLSLFPWWLWLIIAGVVFVCFYFRINPFFFLFRKK